MSSKNGIFPVGGGGRIHESSSGPGIGAVIGVIVVIVIVLIAMAG